MYGVPENVDSLARDQNIYCFFVLLFSTDFVLSINLNFSCPEHVRPPTHQATLPWLQRRLGRAAVGDSETMESGLLTDSFFGTRQEVKVKVEDENRTVV